VDDYYLHYFESIINCIPHMGFAGLSLCSVYLTTATRVNEHISLTQDLHLCIAVEHFSTTWDSFLIESI